MTRSRGVAATGSGAPPAVKWVGETGHGQLTEAAIGADGTLYFVLEHSVVAMSPGGQVAWRYPINAPETDAMLPAGDVPVLGADGHIYVGTKDGLVVLDADGTLAWQRLAGDAVTSPLIDATGTAYTAYFGTPGDPTVVYAFSPRGETYWSLEEMYAGPIPLALDQDANVYLFNTVDPLYTPVWTSLSYAGKQRWSVVSAPVLIDVDGTGWASDGSVTALGHPGQAVTLAGNGAFVPSARGPTGVLFGWVQDQPGGSIVAVGADGGELWRRHLDMGGQPVLVALGDGGVVYAGGVNLQTTLGRLAADGSVLWTFMDPKLASRFSLEISVDADGTIYVMSDFSVVAVSQ